MVKVVAELVFNHLSQLAGGLQGAVNRGIRKQVMVTEGDVKVNIVKYSYVDTGNALGSVRGQMTGQMEGLVSVSAESEQGFPYPTVGNYGSVHQAPRPFFTEAEMKAEREFAGRVRREVESSL